MSTLEGPWTAGVRAALDRLHEQHARIPIDFPDHYGAFPDAWPIGLFLDDIPLVVPDANVLRNDILYACRNKRRTTLINAANIGSIRLYCARHVVDEVFGNSREWTSQSKVSNDTFCARWVSEYLPLLRVVDGDLTTDVLAPIEADRIESLKVTDVNDVPSATLALCLGAFFMTEDRAALSATYGPSVNPDVHHAWVRVLKDGSDAAELGRVVFVGTAAPVAAGVGILSLGRWLIKDVPWWVYCPIAAGLAVAALGASEETRRKIGSGLVHIASVFGGVSSYYYAQLNNFQRLVPKIAPWTELAGTIDGKSLLARACLHTLARSQRSRLTACELAQQLPILGVAQSEKLVRQTLRGYGCFTSPHKGRWQVGGVAQPEVVAGA